MVRKGFRSLAAQLFVAVTVLASPASASAHWNEKVLHSFQGVPDGATPIGGVALDKNGNLYGTTINGGSPSCVGPFQCGVVFQLSLSGTTWAEKVVYVFRGNAFGDGSSPGGGVILDGTGNLYGTTEYGGKGDCVLFGSRVGCGAVYELSPPSSKDGVWTETVIYSFRGRRDGYVPFGALVSDGDGNLYGATLFGGSSNSCGFIEAGCGVIFELSPPHRKRGAWQERVLHRFNGNRNGGGPTGNLVLDDRGNLYGITWYGGVGDCGGGVPHCGTVFELVRPPNKSSAWPEVVIHRFTGGWDGGAPAGTSGLLRDKLGSLYATTRIGRQNAGGAFQFSLPGERGGHWTEHALNCCGDLYQPAGGLVFDATGNIYGSAPANLYGHQCCGPGGVFQLKPSKKGWADTTLYTFPKSLKRGGAPQTILTLDGSGNVYGTTVIGGTGQNCPAGSCGTVFELTPP